MSGIADRLMHLMHDEVILYRWSSTTQRGVDEYDTGVLLESCRLVKDTKMRLVHEGNEVATSGTLIIPVQGNSTTSPIGIRDKIQINGTQFKIHRVELPKDAAGDPHHQITLGSGIAS